MFVTLYRLKKNGQRLPIDEARQHGIQGELRLTRKRPSGMPAVEATLYDDRGVNGLSIRQAEVRQIDANGMLIRGYEGSASELIPQVWWCVFSVQT